MSVGDFEEVGAALLGVAILFVLLVVLAAILILVWSVIGA